MPFARVNGIELCYESIGHGTPLVLIMGLGTQMIAWDDMFCQQLAARGFRVIRFDNRDSGLSSKLDHLGTPNLSSMLVRSFTGLPVPAPYTLRDMAADTVGLLDALDIDRAHVVGASMGGMIGQTIAIEQPHRLRSLTSIMSHPGHWRSKLVRPSVLRMLMQPLPRDPERAIEQQLAVSRALSGPGFPFDEPRARRLIVRSRERGLHPRGFVRQLVAIGASGSRIPALRRVQVPTLVIHGTADPLVPPVGARATAQAVPNARLQWIEGMGHNLPRAAWPTIIDAIAEHAGVLPKTERLSS